MNLRTISSTKKIKSLSYWRYARLKKCEVSGAYPHSVGGVTPYESPSGKPQFLGILFHALLEELHRLRSTDANLNFSELFNQTLGQVSARILKDTSKHHLGDPINWPETALLYRQIRDLNDSKPTLLKRETKVLSEETIYSKDGLLFGQIDALFIDQNGIDLIDYKSGEMLDANSNPKEEYVEQLYFYAYLVKERFGKYPRSLSLIGRDAVPVSIIPDEKRSDDLAILMRTVLLAYNAKVERNLPISAFTSPSSPNCLYCDAKPLCNGFWNEATNLDTPLYSHCIAGRQAGPFVRSKAGPFSISLNAVVGSKNAPEAKVTRIFEGRFPHLKDSPGQLIVFSNIKLLSSPTIALFELTERSIILLSEESDGV